MLLTTIASAQHYYDRSSGLTTDTGFSVPQYDSQEEILTQLVAPFIFLSVLLHMGFSRALRFAFVSDDTSKTLLDLEKNNEPPINRKSMVMAITVTAMLVPTPFWGYVTWTIGLMSLATVLAFAGIVLFVMYLMAS